jgi:membrane-associated phospholipid phosphatase
LDRICGIFEKMKRNLAILFHDIGWNFLRTIGYGHGLFFIGAVGISWVMIASGFDWFWNRLAYKHTILAYLGIPSLELGYVFPIILPLVVFLLGLKKHDEGLKTRGLGLTQCLAVSWGFQSIIKIFTNRTLPNVINIEEQVRSTRLDDYSAEFLGFSHGFHINVLDGWPSGHMATALAAAVCFAALFPEKRRLNTAFYILAWFIGIGVSLNTHWASDVAGGALIGYAAGKVVAKTFQVLR